MKKFLSYAALVAFISLSVFMEWRRENVQAQSTIIPMPPSLFYQWGIDHTATAAVLNPQISLSASQRASAELGLTWTDRGTAPSVCTFEVDESNDGSNWMPTGDPTDCTASSTLATSASVLPYLLYVRVQLDSFTAGDDTTTVNFQFVSIP